MEFIFLHVDKHQCFFKLALFLMEFARHAQSTQNRKLVIFYNILKKKLSQLLLYSIAMQNIQIFYRGPVKKSTLFLIQTEILPSLIKKYISSEGVVISKFFTCLSLFKIMMCKENDLFKKIICAEIDSWHVLLIREQVENDQ